MRIFIDTDMEGLTGIVSESQLERKGDDFRFGQKMLANDVNAAIDPSREHIAVIRAFP